MKNDLSVEIGMAHGAMQQSFSNAKASIGENPQESFDAIFENSFQRAEEQRDYINNQSSDKSQNSRVEPRSERPESYKTTNETNESAQSAKRAEESGRQEKPASDSEYKNVEGNVRETTKAASEAVKSDDSKETTVATKETVKTSMESIQTEIKLNDKQLMALSNLLGITVEELSQMKIEITKGNDQSIKATFPDGTKIDFGKLLGLEENGKLLNGEDAIKKLASLLNIDKEQAESFVKKLGIKSIEISNELTNGTEGNKSKNQTPFLTGKAAESKVVENSERKITIDGKGENLKQAIEDGGDNRKQVIENKGDNLKQAIENKGDNLKQVIEQGKAEVKADTTMAKQGFGLAPKETAAQVRTGNTAKAEPIGSLGARNTSENAAQLTDVKSTAKAATPSRVFSQIVEKASVLSLPNRTEARISLTPANLGTVDIKIIVQDAQVKGTIVVENQQVKKIVEENLNNLKATLTDQGIDVDEITVDINDKNTKFAKQNQTGNESDKNHSRHYAGDENQESSDQGEQEMDIEDIRRAMRNKILDVTA